MQTQTQLTCLGHELDMSPEAFGTLRESNDLLGNAAALHARIDQDGYIFLRDYLEKDRVLEARREIIRRVKEQGGVDDDYPEMEAVSVNPLPNGLGHGLSVDNAPLERLLYSGRMMEYYQIFLGGPVSHFDYTWFRAVEGGRHGIYPHADIVYMGRGTHQLYTSWTPLGDVSMELGGLMILESSHTKTEQLKKYLARDVDTFCESDPDAADIVSGAKQWAWDGRLASDPATLREKLGCRWLTADYRLGDLLSFKIQTVHASLDNHTNRFRFSSDSRYQLACESRDERWIGPNPMAHGPDGKRGLAC